jgi:hypothetical protein
LSPATVRPLGRTNPLAQRRDLLGITKAPLDP